jgi:hypothetical protein
VAVGVERRQGESATRGRRDTSHDRRVRRSVARSAEQGPPRLRRITGAMPPPPPAPTDAELVELFDRLWHDPRRRDDRSEFFECEHCGRAVRWVANLGSRTRSSIQVVARPVTTAAFFDPAAHHGLVAVFTDRTGFTLSRFTERDDVEDAFLYACHWDVCDDARRVRDRMHRERYGSRDDSDELAATDDAVLRYREWRRARD